MQSEFDFSGRPKKRKKTLWERWNLYHEANPHILPKLTEMAYKASRAGQKNIGVAMLFEVLRWKTNVETVQTDGFKIADPLAAVYARVIMRDNLDLRSIFKLKKSEVDPHFPELAYLKTHQDDEYSDE
jgi:hypothetical protein